MKKNLIEILQDNNFMFFGTYATGVIENYVITVSHTQHSMYSVLFSTEITEDINLKKVKSDFKEQYGKKLDLTKANKQLGVSYVFSKRNDIKHFNEFINAVILAFKNNDIRPATNCFVCNQSAIDSLCIDNDRFKFVHEGCVNQQINDNVEKLTNIKTSYILGTVGAFMGMIIGVLPSVLTILWTETIYSILFMIIPVSIVYFYKLFKGKLGLYSLIVTIIMSLISVLFMQYLVIILYFIEMGTSISDSIMLSNMLYMNAEGIIEIITTSSSEYTFLIFGLFFTWKTISASHNEEVNYQKNISNSIISWNKKLI